MQKINATQPAVLIGHKYIFCNINLCFAWSKYIAYKYIHNFNIG